VTDVKKGEELSIRYNADDEAIQRQWYRTFEWF
jgi:hypothetical protein